MTEIRCLKCNKLLAKMEHCHGEIQCTRCGQLNHIEVMDDGYLSVRNGHIPVPFD